ncbi:hypothetical protein [Paenibacillus protaetiae]|uniref:Uncharacterized protein n=1 Tax=Paenibacillus protaetiae TaxID=2509456 RepID=A0A4P6ETT6_9BACL|nr:hypothetical protein [Paenibacillus protaetiae]QAY65473.1 hypothetical protein ET464_02860 [Paenibacillus protaetiae]
MIPKSELWDAHPTEKRINTIMNPDHPLCREDVIWMLEYIKKKVADAAPELLGLAQPRLIQSFHSFAEAAMSLVHRHHYSDQEADRLRRWLRDAVDGLSPEGLRDSLRTSSSKNY